jgi:hypothetical protein
MSIAKRKPGDGLPDGVKVWAAGNLMVVEIANDDVFAELKAMGPLGDGPEVRRLDDGVTFLIYLRPAGGKIAETGFPSHVVNALAALAEERTDVLREARDARAGR